MKSDIRKLKTAIFLFLFFIPQFWAQSYSIDYYGIVSTEVDQNMSKMTSDLYFTQLGEIQNFSVTDKRTEPTLSALPDESKFSKDNLSFFSEVKKNSNDEKWTVTFHVVNNKENKEQTESKTYDSFYKILMEPKTSLQASLKELIENQATKNSTAQNVQSNSQNITSTENLSGTWKGENFIDKIVILRGGRGFVIFNNGVSMNISVELTSSQGKQKVLVTQKGHSNASYFPDLPRDVALNAALTADPITWNLSVVDNNTLKGTKSTLVAFENNCKMEEINVTWTRVN